MGIDCLAPWCGGTPSHGIAGYIGRMITRTSSRNIAGLHSRLPGELLKCVERREIRAVRHADERHPLGRVLELPAVRRLGRDDDRLRRPDRRGHATQAGAHRRVPTCSGRYAVRPIAVKAGLIDESALSSIPSSWVPASGSPHRSPSSRSAPPPSEAEPWPTSSRASLTEPRPLLCARTRRRPRAHGTLSRRAHVMASSADRSVCVGVSSPNKIIASMRASS